MSPFPDGQRPGKAVDKSNFMHTCNLLSQFLKEKRTSSAAALTLPFSSTAKTETTGAATIDLLTNLQYSDDASRQKASAVDFLPQFLENPSIKQSNLIRSETPQPQLSIFYAGKVLVFDAFPPEKATEVMELATKLGSDLPENLKLPPPTSNTPSPAQQPLRSAPQQAPDMRYPRRASLLKFLEKRKERVIAKGPYNLNNPKHDGSSSTSGGDPEHQSSKHFDLNS